jgi:UDP-2,3-diacylglucosamine pyrophosphatase LpxH
VESHRLSWNRKGAVIPAGNMRECRPVDSQRKNRTGSALCGPVPANPEWGAVIPRLCIGILLFYREIIIKDFTTIVFASDFHIPYEDKKAVKLFFKFLEDNKKEIDVLVLGGDIIDFYSLSRFNKDPRRALEIQDDLDKVYEFLKKCREILPHVLIIYEKGNHENRLRTYKWTKAPEFAYLRCLTPEKLFRLDELDIKWEPKRWRYKKLWFMHGDKLSKHSGWTAQKMRAEYGTNVICGHSHRTGKSNRTDLSGNSGGWESGCFCDLNPEYMEGIANWQQGMSVVQYYKDKIFYVHNIDIVYYSFLYNGKYYTL